MNRDLRLLSASLLCWGIGEGLFFYIQPLYLAQLGADPLQVGFILGLAGAAMTITHIPAGILADRFGRRAMMAAAWIFGTVAAVLMFLATSLWVFVAALILYHLTSFVMSPMSSYVTAARGSWSVGRALTTISASFNAGAVVGPFVGGLLAAQVGIRPLYGLATFLFIASTILVFVLRPQPVEAPHETGRLRALAGNGPIRRILVVTLVVVFAMTLSWPLTPLYLNEVRGIPVAQVGALGSAFALGIVVLNLTLGRARARLGSIVGQFLVMGSVLLLWRGLTLPAYALGYFLAGASRTTRSLLSAQVERAVHRAHLGFSFGVFETVASSAMIASPLIAGLLYRTNPAAPFPASLLLILGSIVLAAGLLPADSGGIPASSDLEAGP